MRPHHVALMSLVLAASSCATYKPATGTTSLKEFEQRAPAFNAVVHLPKFETTPKQIQATVRKTISDGDKALDRIGRLVPRRINFDNTVRALDDMAFQYALSMNRLDLIKETSTNAALRDAATDAIKGFEEWAVGLDYREDVYRTSRPTRTPSPSSPVRTPSCSPRPCAITAAPAWTLPKAAARRGRAIAQGTRRPGQRISKPTSTRPREPVELHQGRTRRRAGGFPQAGQDRRGRIHRHGQCHLALPHGHGQRRPRGDPARGY